MIRYKKRKQVLKHGTVELANVVHEKTFTIRELSQLIEKQAKIPAIQGMCIMTAMTQIIPQLLMDGNVINLEGVGFLRASVTLENKKSSVSRIVFTPSAAMREAMKTATLEEIAE
jgi:nucleoid DNA-binding protein